MAEEILGEAIKGRRDQVLISTKATFRLGDGPERRRLVALPPDRGGRGAACSGWAPTTSTSSSCTASTRMTPVEEVLRTLDDLVRAGKIRYIGCSNFSGWHLMKSLAVADQYGLPALRRAPGLLLAGRPRLRVGADAARARSEVGAVVWSPLGWGRLTGKIRRGQPLPEDQPPARASRADDGPPVADEYLYRGRRRARRGREGDRQDGAADRAQLAAAAADRVDRHHRRAQRGAAAPEPRRGRLEPDRGAGREARRGQRSAADLSVLAPARSSPSAIRRRCDRKKGERYRSPFLLGGGATVRLEACGRVVVRQVGSQGPHAHALQALPVG